MPENMIKAGGSWALAASQIQWVHYGKDSAPGNQTRCLGVAAFANDKYNMKLAFAVAGILRSIVFLGGPNNCGSKHMNLAAEFVANAARDYLPKKV